MAALVTVSSDGPDAVEIRIGPTRRLLQPGQSFRVATTARVDVVALPPLSREDLALHMGQSPREPARLGRVAEE